jgi:hypothetical protein
VKARRKIHVQPRVIAEVAKSQMGDMHANTMRWPLARGEFFRERWMVRRLVKQVKKLFHP